MKSNRKTLENMDERAEAGLGTIIVFIALVLVAAIAAGVLLDTGGKLQEKGKRTGTDVSNQISSNLQVVVTQGKRTPTSDVTALNITVTLAAGAEKLDMSQLSIQVANTTTAKHLKHTSAAAGADTFNVTAIRDADNSFKPTTPGMTPGDLFSVNIDLNANSLNLAARSKLFITLIPEIGVPVRADVFSPPSYGDAKIVDFR